MTVRADPARVNHAQGLLRSYDAEIRSIDHHVGRLLQGIDASPHAADTLVVIGAAPRYEPTAADRMHSETIEALRALGYLN